jgi:hypothetical protein
MSEELLLTLVVEHKWLPLLAIVVGFAVRLLKDDTFGPSIPKKFRAPAAFLMGLFAGIVQRKIAGATWLDAAFTGAVAGLLPILGHKLLIEKLRNGAELAIPGLMRPTDKPADKPAEPVENGVSTPAKADEAKADDKQAGAS